MSYYQVFPHSNIDNPDHSFWIAYNHQAFIFIIIFLMKTWYLKILLLFCSTIFAFARKYQGTQDLKFLLEICFFLLVAAMFIFQQEKLQRNDFQLNYKKSRVAKNWEEVIDVLPEAVLLVNEEMEVSYKNPAFNKLFAEDNDNLTTTIPEISPTQTWEYLSKIKDLKMRKELNRKKGNGDYVSLYMFNQNDDPSLQANNLSNTTIPMGGDSAQSRKVYTTFARESHTV